MTRGKLLNDTQLFIFISILIMTQLHPRDPENGQQNRFSEQRFSETRAPRGTDRSPEYNEHFCYKLDSRVKNLTTEWNQKQQHFITHASRSLLWIRFIAVAFRSEEEVFWRRGPPPPPPPPWPILPRPGSAPGQIWPKYLYACARPWALHPYQVS